MVFGKTRMFVFLEIGIIWSSLRIKCPNLRFKYFHFFRILISKYFKNNEISGRKIFCPAEDCFLFGNFYENLEFFSKNFFVRPKIFFFVTNIFFVLTFFFFGKKKLKVAENVRELAGILGKI